MMFAFCVIACRSCIIYYLTTLVDRQGVDIVYCFFVGVCVFVCTVTDFSGENKSSGVKSGTVVYRHPGQGISHFRELFSPRSPKSDESASHRDVNFYVRRHTTIVTLEMRRSWNMARRVNVGRHVWIYGRP